MPDTHSPDNQTPAGTDAAPVLLEYRTEVKQLLDILAHSLYPERETTASRPSTSPPTPPHARSPSPTAA